jgi:AraC-like DNA-binding protein
MEVERVARRWRVYHETYTICTVVDAAGVAELTYRGKLHHATAGDVLIMEPGELHANTRITPPATFRVLAVTPCVVEQAAAQLGPYDGQPHWSCMKITHPDVFRAFARLHASLETPATSLERESRFAACLNLLLRQYTEAGGRASEPPSYSGLRRCRELIMKDCAAPLTLDHLAGVGACSRHHLVRAFAKAFGLPPHAYQMRVRIEKAQRLLADGMAAANVAGETGFADQSHFGRLFLRTTGVTPRQYATGHASRPLQAITF